MDFGMSGSFDRVSNKQLFIKLLSLAQTDNLDLNITLGVAIGVK